MKIPCSLKMFSFAILVFEISVSFAGVDSGYEATISPKHCSADANTGTLWGFYYCNCTSYVAYRLRLNDVRLDGELFDNTRNYAFHLP